MKKRLIQWLAKQLQESGAYLQQELKIEALEAEIKKLKEELRPVAQMRSLVTLETKNQGERLLYMRKRLGIKQGDFAYKVGISQSLLSQIEKGNVGASPDFLEKANRYYGININYVLNGTGKGLVN